MEGSKERDRSSTGSKKKEAFLDLDIGKDFLTSWKSISIGEGDGLDFDLTPLPKSNKKPFNMENEDMDFNLDGDFGKMPSFNMDMPDLDISPPLKKDGKANDKAKESSSFNMDMLDFDLSPPLKDRKASENGKESTSGNDKRKKDSFSFAFAFDELGDFDFRSSLRKEDSNAKKDRDKNERSPNKSDHQIKEVLTHKNISSNINNMEDESKKTSRQGSLINFGMDLLVCEIQDNEPTENGLPSNLAVDDAIISTVSAESVKVGSASDKEKISSESAIVSMGLPPSAKKLVTTEAVGLASETCLAKAAMQDLQPSCIPGDGTIRGNTSEADKVEYMDTSPTGSNAKLDVKLLPTSSTCNNTVSEDSQHIQTETSDKKADEVSGVEDHVRDRTGPGEVNSLAETFCDSSALPGVLCDTPSTNECHKPASSILNLSLKSKQTGISDNKQDEGTKSITADSISFVQSEKAECTSKILSTPEIVSSISTRKAGVIQPSLLEVKRGFADRQLDKRLVSVSLPSKSIFLRTQNQEGCKDMKIVGERCGAGESIDVEKNNDSSLTKNKTLVEIKTTTQGQETSLKDLGTLSMEICKKTAQNAGNETCAGNETPLVSFPATKNVPAGRLRLSSLEGGRKIPELSCLKHSGAEIDKRAAKNVGYAKPLASFPAMNHVLAQEKRLSLFEGDKKVPDLCGLKLSGMKVTEKAARNARDATPLSSSPKVEHVPAEKKRLSSFGGGKKVPDIYGQKLSGKEIAEKAAQNAADETPLPLFPTMKHVPAEERTLSSFGVGGKKAPVLRALKFASLNVGRAKSPTKKDIKSAGGIDRSKQMPSILPMKRKTLGVDAAAVISLQSSKRCFQPLIASSSRNFTGESEKVLEEKASNHSNMEGDTVNDHSEAVIIHRNEKIKGLEISFSIEDNCNIKQAEAYCKELDDLSSILRKKRDEAKEVLVQATVNSNKLLLLNGPLFEQKISSAQKVLARLSLYSTGG